LGGGGVDCWIVDVLGGPPPAFFNAMAMIWSLRADRLLLSILGEAGAELKAGIGRDDGELVCFAFIFPAAAANALFASPLANKGWGARGGDAGDAAFGLVLPLPDGDNVGDAENTASMTCSEHPSAAILMRTAPSGMPILAIFRKRATCSSSAALI
jgi:hypothetical protein